MKVNLFNTTRCKNLPQKKLAKLVHAIIVSEGNRQEVNLILVGTTRIRQLNRKYRSRDRETDVLAFAAEESEEPPPFEPTGEIYICVPRAMRQARRAGHSLSRELLILAAHGALHLCGYTHETPKKYDHMWRRAEKFLAQAMG